MLYNKLKRKLIEFIFKTFKVHPSKKCFYYQRCYNREAYDCIECLGTRKLKSESKQSSGR